MKKSLVLVSLGVSLLLGGCSFQTKTTTGDSKSTPATSTKSSSVSSSKVKTFPKKLEKPLTVYSDSDFVPTASDASFADGVLVGNAYTVKIVDVEIRQVGEDGNFYSKPIVVITYDTEVANSYDDSVPITPLLAWTLNFRVWNSDKVMEKALFVNGDSLENETPIERGAVARSTVAYTLENSSKGIRISADAFGYDYGSTEYGS